VLAEILNVVQVFTLLCYCLLLLLLLFSSQQAEMPKTRVKPENTWGFPGARCLFGYYPHWTLEIVVGHSQAFLIVVQPA